MNNPEGFRPRCLCLDIETSVGPDLHINKIGGWRADSGQEDIVAAGMAHEHLLAILPTGGGKSLCYQLPALSRYWRNGSLTVIVFQLAQAKVCPRLLCQPAITVGFGDDGGIPPAHRVRTQPSRAGAAGG